MGASVLLVDDDYEARDLLVAMIERAGYSVATASNGREALDYLSGSSPELIVLDLAMPVMDGATFRAEQRRRAEWVRIPTVVMTGTSDEPLLDLAVERTLHKPVRFDDVIALVRAHCRMKTLTTLTT